MAQIETLKARQIHYALRQLAYHGRAQIKALKTLQVPNAFR